MAYYGGGGAREIVNCLICCENVDWRGRKVVNLPSELGGRPVDAFLKICELLGVPYSEIQGDWRFPDGGGGGRNGEGAWENFPFCLVCVKGFQSVVKLQKQLVEIQAKIEERISSIREQIRGSVNKIGGGSKEATFRLKALALHQGGFEPKFSSAPPNSGTGISSSNFTTTSATTTQDSLWTLWPQNSSSTYVPQQELVTLPVPPTDTKTIPSAGQNYHEGGPADDDYFGPQHDSDNDSSTSEDNPPPKPRPKQKTYSILPSVLRRLQTNRQSISRARKTERQAEYFSPIEKNPQGQMFYEGILITPINRGGYRCGQCDASVGKAHDSISLRKTKIHIKGFHLGAYKCSLCSKNFSSNDILNQHITRHHNGQNVACPICGKIVRDRTLKHHEYSHMNASEKEAAIRAGFKVQTGRYKGEPRYPCRICDKKFHKPSNLQRHELSHVDPKFRRDFKCPHCDKAFAGSQARKLHIMRVHESLNVRKRLCTICGKSVFYKDLAFHMKSRHSEHLKEKCRHCKKDFRPDRLARHEDKCKDLMKKVPGREFGCDVCSRYFKDRKSVLCHRRKVHKSVIPLKLAQEVSVDNTGEGFLEDLNNEGIQHVEGNIYDYQLYQLEKMEGGGGYKCLTCTEKLEGGDEDELEERVKDHVRSKHIGNFRCNKCTKRMKTLFQVQVHHRLEHSTLSGYDCEICGRLAIPEKSFKKHLWQHKNVWEVEECINTGYSFPINYTTCDTQEVLKGMGVEVNLKCWVCEQSGFDKVEDLYSHRRKDHADKPIVPFPKVTDPQGRLSKYPDGPIDCPICGKTCGDKIKFACHRYKVHGRLKREGNVNSVKEEDPPEVKKDMVEGEVNSEEEEEDVPVSYNVGGLKGTPRRSGNRKVIPGCKYCGKVLSRLGVLREHEESCGRFRAGRTKENGFIVACEICRLRFKRRKDVTNHKRRVHRGREQSLDMSNLTTQDSSSEKEDEEVEEKIKEEKNEEDPTSLDASRRTSSRSGSNKVIHCCRHCGKVLSRPNVLREHEEKCGLMRAERTKENGYIFSCDICKLRFRTKKGVREHRRKVHKRRGQGHVNSDSSAQETNSEDEKDEEEEGEKQEAEEKEGTQSSFVAGLRGSARRSRNVILSCKHCGKVLSRPNVLRDHEEKCAQTRAERTKENGFIFSCDICKLRFTTKKGVREHRRKVHIRRGQGNVNSDSSQGTNSEEEDDAEEEAEKPQGDEEKEETPSSFDTGLRGTVRRSRNVILSCRHCRKVLSRPNVLREHEEKCGLMRAKRTKKNGFIFACEICRLRFRTKKGVRDHKSKVHKLKGQNLGNSDLSIVEANSEEEEEAPSSYDIGGDFSAPIVVGTKRKKFIIVAEEDNLEAGGVKFGEVKIEVDYQREESADEGEFWDSSESSHDDLSSEEEEVERGEKKRKMDGGCATGGRRNLRDRSSLKGSHRNVNYAESDEEEESE